MVEWTIQMRGPDRCVPSEVPVSVRTTATDCGHRRWKGRTVVEINVGTGAISLPDYWQELQSLPDDPPGTRVVGQQTEVSEAMVLVSPIGDQGYFMPIDQQAVLQGMRPALAQSGSGLVEADTGTTTSGEPFVYTIVKGRMDPSGVQYTLTLHAQLPERIQIQGFFSERGVTGAREAAVLELKRRDGTVTLGEVGLEGWMRDPYDPSVKGFLMNLAETHEYDPMFPGHPLTQARLLVEAVSRSSFS